MDQSSEPKQRLDEPVVVLFETSPYGTLDAIVQHDGMSVYFYLHESRQGQPNVFGTRACWVRNLDVGPFVLNEDEMRQGLSPMLPRTHTKHREGLPIPDSEQLQVVWLEEGNGAALLETNDSGEQQTLAVIPPWSGIDGFHGYSSQCAMESPLCWPMPDNPRLEQRIQQAKQFWQQFQSSPDPFSTLQPQILATYDSFFKKKSANLASKIEPRYFSIDGGNFPPKGMVVYETPDDTILMTVGVSLCPQPAVEMFTEEPRSHRRIELAIRVRSPLTEDRIQEIGSQLSGLASLPWRKFTWLGTGHTCQLPGLFQGYESALLVHDSVIHLSKGMDLTSEDAPNPVEFPLFRDDPINLLWVIPITPDEQTRLQNSELTATELLQSNPRKPL